jgi:probable phosphoglycerate mutase
MELILIRAARTAWDEERRVAGNLDIPLGPEGLREIREGLPRAGPIEAKILYASPTLSASQTAQVLAKGSGRSVRKVEGLREVDLGLWQGLFESDLKRKHRKAYATWKAAPLAVLPPRGEGFRDAYWRLSVALDEILAANRSRPAAAVVAPKLAYRMIECRLLGVQPEEFWEEEALGFRVARFKV